MHWFRLLVNTPPDSAEAVAAALMDVGCQGVAEEVGTIAGYLPPDSHVELAVETLNDRLSRFGEFGLPLPGLVRVSSVDDSGWADEWRKYYKPMEIGRRLVVKPSWETYSGDPSRVIVELDPGMAFGTGGHATTRLCLEALDELVQPGMVVADIGTGSGILAIAAAKLGAGRVHATDIDSLPRKIARENVTLNGLDSVVTVHEMDDFEAAAHDCDLVVANIIAEAIIELAPSVRSRVKPGGVFISSGIVAERLPDVLLALEADGFRVEETREDEVWRAVVARNPGA